MAKLRLLKTGHGDLTLAEWDKNRPETVATAESAVLRAFHAGTAGLPPRRARPDQGDPPVRRHRAGDPDRPGHPGRLIRQGPVVNSAPEGIFAVILIAGPDHDSDGISALGDRGRRRPQPGRCTGARGRLPGPADPPDRPGQGHGACRGRRAIRPGRGDLRRGPADPDPRGGRGRAHDPRRRPLPVSLLRGRPRADGPLLDGEAPARGQRLRPRGRARGLLVSPARHRQLRAAGGLRPARRGRDLPGHRGQEQAAAHLRRADRDRRRLPIRRASPSWSPPSSSATSSSPRNSTSSASSTASR